jgi:hypothetical protein
MFAVFTGRSAKQVEIMHAREGLHNDLNHRVASIAVHRALLLLLHDFSTADGRANQTPIKTFADIRGLQGGERKAKKESVCAAGDGVSELAQVCGGKIRSGRVVRQECCGGGTDLSEAD